ncbi:MAG: hypothetical protein H6865_06300 [Rhodospirillales bacterium]|nr:hypothetical protein [Alphaproteobacteria bacterium]MCB9987232.1 hypothetical protein [Rhodospirillales bacterium]USO07907.1 MAG: hypothetical protein H6866_01400 [Rhodospirillales bacterium]
MHPARQPLIIGLPGSGKEAVNREIARMLGREVIETDQAFRRLRAVSSRDPHPEGAVMRRFLARAEHEFSDMFNALAAAAEPDPRSGGKCRLWNGKYFRTEFGEAAFRTFESEVVRWLDKTGALAGKVVDISSSLILREENRRILDTDRYAYVLLDTAHEGIVDNLLEGFRDYQQDHVVRRGAYELAAQAAIADEGRDTDTVVRMGLERLSLRHRGERMALFNALAVHRVPVARGEAPAVAACAIIRHFNP